jgi:hypothetical protein
MRDMFKKNGSSDVQQVRSFVLWVNSFGLLIGPCAVLLSLSKYYFPEAEITVRNFRNGKEYNLRHGDLRHGVISLLELFMSRGSRVQFTCKMNDASFKVFKNILLLLRDNYDSMKPVFDCKGDIERLVRELKGKKDGVKLFSTRSKAEKK